MTKKRKKNKDFKEYIVETGSYRKTVEAESLETAIISAFTLFSPKEPSLLTRVKERRPMKKKRKDGQWHYIDTKVMLKKTGYKI